MTMIDFFATTECAVCGKVSQQAEIMSTNTLGSPDLDTRPSEMARSTLEYWVQECPHCGYVAGSLKEAFRCDKENLDDPELLNLLAKFSFSALARSFVKKAWISRKEADYVAAFWDYLHGAWVSDDMKDETGQIELRKMALQMMENFSPQDMSDNLRVLRADLLRKTRQFERLAQEYENMRFEEDELLERIVRFQILLAQKEDVGTYTVEDVPELSGEALREYVERKHGQAPRPHVLKAFDESLDQFDELYRRLAE